jgi:cytochrome b involved in lipid metabolism
METLYRRLTRITLHPPFFFLLLPPSLTHSLTPSPTHSLTPSLIHSPIPMASDIRPPTDKKTGKARAKVSLRPGFHLMDWMRLPLRPARPRAISSAELASHCTKYDCWTALHGKVYNITQYMDYHPGGGSILMKGAGKDCTALFNKYHAWVNIDGLLTKCLVGVLADDSAPPH